MTANAATTGPPIPSDSAPGIAPAVPGTAQAAPDSGQVARDPRAARLIDPRGQRFGAGLSVAILIAGFALGTPVVVPFLAVVLGVSALFGTRYSLIGRPWPIVRKVLHIGPPKELEHELPPRFAQALGFVGLTLATTFFLLGLATVGWVIAAAVGALQALLAVTGYCLGCRLYFLKWWVPAQFQKLTRRTTLA